MRSPILFLHSEDDHMVPIHVAQQVSLAQKATFQLIQCKLRQYFLTAIPDLASALG